MLSALSTGDILSIMLFAGICTTLMLGYPIALTLAGTSLMIAFLGHALGVFDYSILNSVPSRYLGSMTNDVLVAVPLFIFMGLILEKSGIAEQLLTTMGQLFGKLRGGLGYSVVIVGALLAASTGVVGATVITMGLIALPAMLRAGYGSRISTGVICGSATLAQIIPPSTVLIFVGDLLAGINQEAQLRRGNFAPDPVSVGDLFAGALIPGFIMVGLYLLWIVYKSIFQPEEVPAMKMTEEERAGLSWRVVSALVPPLLLVLAVLGSILFGIATPSESASVGAIGAMLLAGLNRRMSFATLKYATMNTMMTTCVIFVIVIAASLFSLVFRGLGGEHMVESALSNVPGGVTGALMVVMFIMFILGFFLDTFEIILIMLPVCGPALLGMGVDPVWLGILIGVNLQTSFLTPPFGFTLFYMRSIAPPSITTGEIWLGSIPWTWLQMFSLGIVWLFPGTATWLPKYLFSGSAAPAIHGPATAGEKPGTTPSRNLDSILGTTKFDKDGMPVESDDPFSQKKK